MGRVVVDPDAVTRMINDLGAIGTAPGGGVTRLTYDESWKQAADYLREVITNFGLETYSDAAGNVFGRLKGYDGERTVLTGSHIDSVPEGGRFDGALGIVGGILALASLKEQVGQPRHNLEVVALCEEEGSRFAGDYLGSRAIVGRVTVEELHECRGVDGISIADAMTSVGLVPEAIAEARRDDLEAFLELHIEQGPVLEAVGSDIGLVTGITSLAVLEVVVTGQADHAGTTPMKLRRDPMRAAARMVTCAGDAALAIGEPTVVTVGQFRTQPSGVNVVAGRAEFSVDARHPDIGQLRALIGELQSQWKTIASEERVVVEVRVGQLAAGCRMDRHLQEVLQRAAATCGFKAIEMTSGAGHDSQVMATSVPTAMLFVPSIGGRSHSTAEYTDADAAARGVAVLSTALYELGY